MAIDKEGIVWLEKDPESGWQVLHAGDEPTEPLLFVSAKFFVRFMEAMADNPEVLRMINCPGTMELDEETAGEIVQEFLNYVADEVHATEKE